MKSKIVLFSFCALVLGCNDSEESSKGHENNSTQQEQKVYTCPMHPEIIRNEPGQCPICGMDLVEKKTDGQKESNKDLELLLKPTNQYVISQVNTITADEKELPIRIFAMGTITYDTRQINTVAARVSGRIEKLCVKYRYQPVTKGQKLLDLYSKDLETEQQNLLFLLKNDSENLSLIKASEQKLLLLGLTTEQVRQIKTTDKTFYAVTIYSPYTGHLHDVMSTGNSIQGGTEMKNERMNSSAATEELQVKEGMYISKGQTIFNIYDTKTVWALLNIYPDAQSSLKEGQKVKLEIDGLDNEIKATIDFIEPVIRENEKNITARTYLSNPSHKIKIGAIVKATIEGKKQKGLFVPVSAILSLGMNDVVFLKQNGLFKARKVQPGISSGEWIEIISGISKSDTIAENGQLLMDSESFIKIETK